MLERTWNSRRPGTFLTDAKHRYAEKLAAKARLIDLHLESLASEYADLSEVWKVLDTKAQIAAAAAGIFLGGAFAVQRVPSVQLPQYEKWLLTFALLLLVASVICALKALELRETGLPPRGVNADQMLSPLYETEEFVSGTIAVDERIERFKIQQIEKWKSVNQSTMVALKSKTRWTVSAQYLFCFGALVFAGLSVGEIFLRNAEINWIGGV